jgi:hypothetical protein
MQAVRAFSDIIHMEFGLFEKCATVVLNRGKIVLSLNLILDFNRERQGLEKGKTYNYVAIEEIVGIQHKKMTERLKKEYSRILRTILISELNTKNKITAIGALAVLVLRYSFGNINWRIEEIRKIDREARNV